MVRFGGMSTYLEVAEQWPLPPSLVINTPVGVIAEICMFHVVSVYSDLGVCAFVNVGTR